MQGKAEQADRKAARVYQNRAGVRLSCRGVLHARGRHAAGYTEDRRKLRFARVGGEWLKEDRSDKH